MTITERIRQKLAVVIDPGTNISVTDMGLIRNLTYNESDGKAALTFAPSSPVCPLAFRLAADITNAVKSVEGVAAVELRIENHNRAREIEELINTVET